ncbi:chaperonin 10-like protein [Truncatella angustata]|uniref:Chaperonin 10-like protein n=1 Tax=Truncatella angustata TaxID=152316 RepID=A0A9P8UMF8_9PEZI|nr:chaperonin 10-like protein [Truncatella angustata]KAH6654788.1 chaperonin 10-like protein [Truncatella angustata]KAH8196028.1 hypothetical protein TruAng_009804 [Truncatella angustata]
MPSNKAAYLTAEKTTLEVKPAPYPELKENGVIVRTRAVALNPVDWAQQALGPEVFTWLKFPAILGYDVAGEVVDVGSDITRFKVGDRVAGHATGCYQEFVLVEEHCASILPAAISFEQAAVLPLCLGVAAKTLFHPEYLALEPPCLNPKPTGKTVLVWGGSTSVGCNAIQLAKAAGYEVITTASPANFEYVKKLGASHVFDYNSSTVKDDLVAAVKGKTVAGTIANGGFISEQFPAIVEACAAVALSSPENCKLIPLTMVPRFPLPGGVETKFVDVWQGDKDLASSIFNRYLPGALEDGSFVPAPPPQVVGHGLESVQKAIDLLQKGVSAKKIVVTF